MADNVTTVGGQAGSSPPPETIIETIQQGGGEHRQVVEVGSVDATVDVTTTVGTISAGAVRDYGIEVAAGNISGVTKINKFGFNPDIASGTEEVWSVGGNRPLNTANISVELVSSDGNDTAAGSGAQAVTVQYVDIAFAAQETEIEMNGTGATATIDDFGYLNRAWVSRTGTFGGNNDGTITIRAAGAGATQGGIRIGRGQTEQSHFAVASGKTLYMTRAWINTASTKTASAELYQLTAASDVTTPFSGAKRKLDGFPDTTGNPAAKVYWPPKTITGPAIVWWEATVGATGAVVEAGFDGYLL